MKVKFTSKKVLFNYVEETEEGELVEVPKAEVDVKEIEAEVLEERKYTYLLQLPDGNVIVKKKGLVTPLL